MKLKTLLFSCLALLFVPMLASCDIGNSGGNTGGGSQDTTYTKEEFMSIIQEKFDINKIEDKYVNQIMTLTIDTTYEPHHTEDSTAIVGINDYIEYSGIEIYMPFFTVINSYNQETLCPTSILSPNFLRYIWQASPIGNALEYEVKDNKYIMTGHLVLESVDVIGTIVYNSDLVLISSKSEGIQDGQYMLMDNEFSYTDFEK